MLVYYTVKEPIRGGMDAVTVEQIESAQKGDAADDLSLSITETLKILWGNKIYRYTAVAHIMAIFFTYASSTWMPALFMRQYGMDHGAVSGVVGAVLLFGGVPGMLLGGYWADRLGKRSGRWRAYMPAIGVFLSIPAHLIGFTASSVTVATVFFVIGAFFIQLQHGPGFAIVQSTVSPKMRAVASAVLILFSNIIGLALGPLVVGAISDMATPQYGDKALSIAMIFVLMCTLLSVFAYWKAGRQMDDVSSSEPSAQ